MDFKANDAIQTKEYGILHAHSRLESEKDPPLYVFRSPDKRKVIFYPEILLQHLFETGEIVRLPESD